MTRAQASRPKHAAPFATRQILAAFGLIAGFAIAAATWGSLAPLGSAVVAAGIVSVETHRQAIQHLEGGIVERILVREGRRGNDHGHGRRSARRPQQFLDRRPVRGGRAMVHRGAGDDQADQDDGGHGDGEAGEDHDQADRGDGDQAEQDDGGGHLRLTPPRRASRAARPRSGPRRCSGARATARRTTTRAT
jgi:hypothetical protein